MKRKSVLDQQEVYEKWKTNRSLFQGFCEIMGSLAVMIGIYILIILGLSL